jgi:hypothetical protein
MATVGTQEEPLCLVYHVMPWLKTLEEQVAGFAGAGPSHKSVVEAMQFLGAVAVQDALELAPKYPGHPVHRLLKSSPVFRWVRVGSCTVQLGCV